MTQPPLRNRRDCYSPPALPTQESHGSVGLVHALGWYSTKHSVGCYSTTPRADGYARVDEAALQETAAALPRREPAGTYGGRAIVEATSVTFERDGEPSIGLVSLITGDGRRALAGLLPAAAGGPRASPLSAKELLSPAVRMRSWRNWQRSCEPPAEKRRSSRPT